MCIHAELSILEFIPTSFHMQCAIFYCWQIPGIPSVANCARALRLPAVPGGVRGDRQSKKSNRGPAADPALYSSTAHRCAYRQSGEHCSAGECCGAQAKKPDYSIASIGVTSEELASPHYLPAPWAGLLRLAIIKKEGFKLDLSKTPSRGSGETYKV